MRRRRRGLVGPHLDGETKQPPLAADAGEHHVESHLLRSRIDEAGEPQSSRVVERWLADEFGIEKQDRREVELAPPEIRERFREARDGVVELELRRAEVA